MDLSGHLCNPCGSDRSADLRHLTILPLIALLSATAPPPIPAGIWSNEEDRYFAGEAGGKPVPDWLGIEVEGDGRWRRVDAFGKALGSWQTEVLAVTTAGGRVRTKAANGVATELRRAAAFRCWVSVRKHAAKPDGSPDWTFHPGLKLHRQGGRAQVSDPAAPPVVIRLRDVVWPPPSTNKPSLVLYVHKPEEPDKSVSYAWADPKADLIGINLRWMQGSCSREEAK
jgi:hypothetical protein